ncbi:MAG: zinc-binding dehydrogenase [Holophaga sp.]|jgi:threonine dehydrogenase-like Zn-dependent dehydrogenase
MLTSELHAPGKIRLIEVPEPELAPAPPEGASGQIIFQPETACLCGSDLPYFNGSDEWPIELGHSLHEMIGTVVATNGKRWRVGDRVLGVPRMQRGLSERFILDEDRAVRIATSLPEEQILMAQPLGTVIFALKKLPNILDLDVAVVGQGPMGQLMNAALSNLGARNIIGLDLVESRLQVSPRMGATATVCNARRDPIAAVKELLGGSLPDIVIECVGHKDQQFNLCIDLCKEGGRLLFFGVPPAFIDGLRWRDLLTKNVTVHTSMNPDFRRDFPLAVRWLEEGRIDVSPIITHTYPLVRLQEAFELFRDRKDGAIKVIIRFPSRRV